MDRKGNKNLTPLAQKLRKDMTKEERHLWYDFLRMYPVRFTRQKVLGHYIADFYCASAKLVIELDGSQHYDPTEQAKDQERTKYLEGYQLKVLRFSNLDVMRNFDGVCTYIDEVIKERTKGSPAQGELAPQATEGSKGSPAQGELSPKVTEGSKGSPA